MIITVNILQELRDSEINFSIEASWDGGFYYKLGDSLNGFEDEGVEHKIDQVLLKLEAAACACYPKSSFAEKRAK